MNKRKQVLRKPSHSDRAQSTKSLVGKQTWLHKIRDGFTTLTAIVSFVAAVLSILVLYAGNKGAFQDLTNDFYGWLYEGEAWTGLFSNFPEGYVDMEDMDLTDTTTQLVLDNDRGILGGVFSNKRLCKVGFPHGYKLVKGEIAYFGKSATVTVYDHIGGREQVFAQFDVTREGIVLNLTPHSNSTWLIKGTERIAQHPAMSTKEAIGNLSDFCADELKEFMNSFKNRPPATGKREPIVETE